MDRPKQSCPKVRITSLLLFLPAENTERQAGPQNTRGDTHSYTHPCRLQPTSAGGLLHVSVSQPPTLRQGVGPVPNDFLGHSVSFHVIFLP